MNKLLAALLVAGFASQAQADVRITEWMYSGGSGEFIEFTNLGTSAVDFTGWSYDDDSRTPGVFSLSAFGLVGAGESVIITETEAATFRLDWRLADGRAVEHHQWHDPAVRTLQMVRTAEDGSSVLLVLNGLLDTVEVTLTDGPDGPWELRWDSTWEHPDEITSAAVNGALHPVPGARTVMDPLSMRVYVA